MTSARPRGIATSSVRLELVERPRSVVRSFVAHGEKPPAQLVIVMSLMAPAQEIEAGTRAVLGRNGLFGTSLALVIQAGAWQTAVREVGEHAPAILAKLVECNREAILSLAEGAVATPLRRELERV
jgi:hypothetical protein